MRNIKKFLRLIHHGGTQCYLSPLFVDPSNSGFFHCRQILSSELLSRLSATWQSLKLRNFDGREFLYKGCISKNPAIA